jgi:hypothetical protein
MKEILQKSLELAKAGYWDAAIELIQEVIDSMENPK